VIEAAETGPGRVVAFFDIGSNAVRMMCARVDGDGDAEPLLFDRVQTRLGDGGFSTRRLRPTAIFRTVEACGYLVRQAREAAAAEFVAVATAAVREAGNAATLLDLLRTECGLEVRVLSGEEEAALAHRAMRRRVDAGDGTLLTIDIGGGSTEVALGRGDEALVCASLPLGVLRLTAAAFPSGYEGVVDDARYALLRAEVKQSLRGVAAAVRQHGVGVAAGTGGTVRSLSRAAAMVLPTNRRRSDDVLWRPELLALTDMLRSLTLENRRLLPGLEPERADVIVAGAAILETLLEGFAVDELLVPDVHLLRDGLLVDYVEAERRRA